MTPSESGISLAGVEIAGAVIALREITMEDVKDVYSVIGDDRVTQTLSFSSRSLGQCEELVRGVIERAQSVPRQEYYLAMTFPAQRSLIGFVRLGLSGVCAAKLGFALNAKHWGNGYATDGARAAVSFAFERLGVHRITAAIGPANSPSVAVIHRLGFSREGRLRDHVYTNGKWRDSELYSVLCHEWPAARTGRDH